MGSSILHIKRQCNLENDALKYLASVKGSNRNRIFLMNFDRTSSFEVID